MKKYLSLILVICLLFLFNSCKNNPDEKELELSEEEIIKQNVIQLIEESENQKDPGYLFSYFDGDYEITNITDSKQYVQSMKRKDDVTHVSLRDSQYFGIESSGYLFYVSDKNENTKVQTPIPLPSSNMRYSTIFNSFGFDTSALYGEETTSKPFKITTEMLTVSADKKSCSFSDVYLDVMAKDICSSLGYSANQTKTILEKYQGSGIYTVEDNKVTFEFEFQDQTLGNVKSISSYSVDKEQKVNIYSFVEVTDPKSTTSIPTIIEVDSKNVVYKDNKPVSATFQVKTTLDESYYDYIQSPEYFVNLAVTRDTTFNIDCTNPDTPKAIVKSTKNIKEIYKGRTWTESFNYSLTIDLSRPATQLTYMRNSEVVLKADKVKFSSPETIPSVPKRVKDAVTIFIMENF